MRRYLVVISISCLLVLLSANPIAAATKTIDVDCSKGKTISAALADDAATLVIQFQGTCAEAVVIERDNVTLRGVGEAAIDGATLLEPKPDGVTVRGAANVMLADFVVRGMRDGVHAMDGAALSLQRVTIEGNRNHGLMAMNRVSLNLRDVTARHNGRDGIGFWGACGAALSGAVIASDNARVGVIVSDSTVWNGPTVDLVVEADGNETGLQFQVGAVGRLFGPVSVFTRRNSYGVAVLTSAASIGMLQSIENAASGVAIGDQALFTASGTISGNGEFGVESTYSSLISLTTATVSNNAIAGIVGERSTWVRLSDTSVQGNGAGVYVDESNIRMTRTTVLSNPDGDLLLSFGTLGTFASGNTVGTVECDETVLVRGSVTCPAAPVASLEERAMGKNGRFARNRPLPRALREPLQP